MTLGIYEVEDPGQDVQEAIVLPLRASNRRRMPRLNDAVERAWCLTDDAGDIVGGLWAKKRLDWAYIEFLVVPEDARGKGIGADLVARAEAWARAEGTTGAWLLTFGFQARGFYEKLGYECVTTFEGASPEADEHIMRKRFG